MITESDMTYLQHAETLTELAWYIQVQDDKINLLENNKRSLNTSIPS